MISVKQDSELMTNYVAANPIPAGRQFSVFRDAANEPAVISIGKDQALYLSMDSHEQPSLKNLSEDLGWKGNVQAFVLQQNTDLSMDICVAVESGTTSDLCIFRDIQPSELAGSIPTKKILHGSGFKSIYGLYMGSISKDSAEKLPVIFAAFTDPSRPYKTSDLSFVVIDSKGQLSLDSNWRLDTNPERILDVSIGTSPFGQGVFILYMSGAGTPLLLFKPFRSDAESESDREDDLSFVSQPICPPDATCIASYVDPKRGQSSILLVGGSDIRYYTSSQYTKHNGVGTVIADASKLAGQSSNHSFGKLKDIHVSQPLHPNADFHIWFTNDKDAVYYYDTKASDVKEGTVIPLLPEGQGGRISTMLALRPTETTDGESYDDSGLVVSSLVSVDENANLSLLQQDPVSKLWQRYPFFHHGSSVPMHNTIEVKSYLLRFHTFNSQDDSNSQMSLKALAAPGCWLKISSSGVVRCRVNGRPCTLSPASQWLQTDMKGVLNVLLTTDDITCHTFKAEAYRPATSKEGSDEQSLTSDTLDPSRKVLLRLNDIRTVDDLKNATNSQGKSIVSASVKHEDLQAAVDALKTLKDHGKTVLSKGDANVAMVTFATPPALGSWLDDIGKAFSEAWHWVEHQVEAVEKWVVQTAEKVVDAVKKVVEKVAQFVVKVAGTTYNFIMDTVPTIIKGVTWVFKKIGAAIQDVIDFFGFWFNWDDVLTTADSISTCFQVTLDYGKTMISGIEAKIDNNLTKLRSNIKANLTKVQGIDYKAATSPASTSGADHTDDDHKTSVAHNWGSYQFAHGGATSNASVGETKLGDSAQILKSLFDEVQGEFAAIAKLFAVPLEDFIKFLGKGDYDISHLIQMIAADTVDALLDALTKFIRIIAKALELGCSLVGDFATARIDIPVLTWLWEKVIAKRDFTLLNLATLLIAIPTTLLFKTAKKRTPPKLKGRVEVDGFKAYLEEQNFKSDPSLTDDIKMIRLASEGCISLIAADFEALSTVGEGAIEGLKIEKFAKIAMSSVGTVLDTLLLIYDVIECFQDWPVEAQDTPADLESWCRWAKYSLKLANTAALFTIVIIRKNASEDTKPLLRKFRAAMATVVAVPRFAIALTEKIDHSIKGGDDAASQAREYLIDALEFGEQLGFTASHWDDEVKSEIAYIGLAVELGCAIAGGDVKVANFVAA